MNRVIEDENIVGNESHLGLTDYLASSQRESPLNQYHLKENYRVTPSNIIIITMLNNSKCTAESSEVFMSKPIKKTTTISY